MKLLTKTSLAILLVTLLIFMVSGFMLFQGLQTSIREEADKDLLHESEFLENLLDKAPQIVELEHSTIFIELVSPGQEADLHPIFGDTLMAAPGEQSASPYRYISFQKEVQGQQYRMLILHPLANNELLLGKFLQYLLWVSIVLVLLIMVSMLVISRKMWSPFYASLKTIENFDVKAAPPIFPDSKTLEFQQLNTILAQLTNQVSKDYRNLKEFFEESSHELQTPLAIVQAKLDRLTQSGSLSREDIQLLNSAQNSVRKLSNITKDLLMIGKIENRQFGEGREINFKTVFGEQLNEVGELITLREIELEEAFKGDFRVKMPPDLASVLASNLIANAINHNHAKGKIKIVGEADYFEVINSGRNEPLQSPQIFDRFVKDSQSGSTGLGLAIVKRICTAYGLNIHYEFKTGDHIFRVQKA